MGPITKLMDKKLLIGLGGIAAAGLIGGGVRLASNEFDFLKQSDVEVEEERRQTAQKIEDLYFEELKNTKRYSFCVGKEKITGNYKNTIMGGERGEVSYSSDDISLLAGEFKLPIFGKRFFGGFRQDRL